MKPLFSAQELLEAEQRNATLKAMIPSIIEEYSVNARLKREKFNALIREGFTEDQALQIVIAGNESIGL